MYCTVLYCAIMCCIALYYNLLDICLDLQQAISLKYLESNTKTYNVMGKMTRSRCKTWFLQFMHYHKLFSTVSLTIFQYWHKKLPLFRKKKPLSFYIIFILITPVQYFPFLVTPIQYSYFY